MDELKELKDIKDIVEIDTFNPYWLLFGIVIILLFIALAILLKRKRVKRYKFKLSPKEMAWQRIQNLDYSNAKEVAYTFNEDVEEFISEDKQKEYKDILKELEPFKYKKDVPAMDRGLIERVKKFIKGLKWVD